MKWECKHSPGSILQLLLRSACPLVLHANAAKAKAWTDDLQVSADGWTLCTADLPI